MDATALPPRALPLVEDGTLERGADGRHRVRYRFSMPYFGFFWKPLIARRARRIEEAADAGARLPGGLPWWAPPVPQSLETSAAVACICLLSGVWSYGGGTGGLLTQTLPYAADRFDVGDSALGTGLAIVRIGALLALGLALFSDRFGRRRFVIWALVAHCLLTATLGLAPSFGAYIGGHVALRCIDVSLGVALAVLAAESVPAGNRAITLALVLLANGVGLALAVGALPIAAAGEGGFAVAYGLQLIGLPLVFDAARRLRESPRYVAHVREPHRFSELARSPYRGRVLIVGAAGLLSAIFFAPTAEFFNRYLDDVHGFSSYEIVAFLAITGGPSFLMLVAGGRAADLLGRKSVGIPLVLAGTVGFAAFYLVDGIWLWVCAFAGSMLGSAGGAALAPYRVELFPTRVRGAAGTVLAAAAVIGSAAGLGAVALLSDSLGVGESIAVLAVAPLLGALIVVLRFPETARQELELTSLESRPRGP